MVDDDPTFAIPKTRPILDAVIAGLLASGYGAPVLVALVFSSVGLGIVPAGMGMLAALAGWVALIFTIRSRMRAGDRWKFVVALEVLVLVILPLWGLFYNHVASGECVTTACDSTNAFRPLAEPEVFGLLAGHAGAAAAYLVSRRRPEALSPWAECLIGAALAAGSVLELTVAIQLGPWLAAGVVAPPVFLPAIAPPLAIVLFLVELRARLRRRGLEAAERRRVQGEASAEASLRYRAPVPEPLPAAWARVDPRALARALAASPVVLGLYAVAHAAWLGTPSSALQVFTRTCDHTFSQIPIVILPADCHYLCTVAARGHAGLVKPLRLGRRGGIPIVVNRQLALANAFEDLLHERWPRFGRLARRIYDRLGWPLSRRIQSRWAADAVYLAMKPAEWLFYVALLVLDRKPPEARIDRMYR